MADLEFISSCDRVVYPTAKPVEPTQMESWLRRCPDFGSLYFVDGDDRNVVGMTLSIPLNASGWEKLITGSLQESDIAAEHLFDPDKDTQLGVHLYHIEKRTSVFGTPFITFELHSLARAVDHLRAIQPKLTVLGFSGLAASLSGIDMLAGRLQMHEIGFCEEHMFRKGEENRIVTAVSPEERARLEALGWVYSHRCRMLVTRAGEASPVWDVIRASPL
jgi:hypothetical protein